MDPMESKRKSLLRWLRSAALVSLVVAELYWIASLLCSDLIAISGDSILLLLWFVVFCLAAGLFQGIVGFLAGLIWPIINHHQARLGLLLTVWPLYFLGIHMLAIGVYFDDWGIESKWTALAIRAGQAGIIIILSIALGFFLAWIFGVLGRKRARFVVLVVLLGPLFFALITSGGRKHTLTTTPFRDMPMNTTSPPMVAVLGFDGMSWNVLEPLIQSGDMPNFAWIREHGISGSFETLPSGASPLVWNTISTGLPPADHGIQGQVMSRFVGMQSWFFPPMKTGFNHAVAPIGEALHIIKRRKPTSADRRRPTLWAIATLHRESTILVNWYHSWPREQLLGFVATQGLYGRIKSFGKSDHLSVTDLDRYLSHAEILEEVLPTGWTPGSPVPLEFEFLTGVVKAGLRQCPNAGLLLFYTSWPDAAQHHNWQYLEPDKYFGVSGKDVLEFGGVIPDLYRELDQVLGRILESLPTDCRIMILSDHGFGAVFNEYGTYGGHSNGPPGIFMMAGPGIKVGAKLDHVTVFDVAPTVSFLRGYAISEEWPGHILRDAFEEPLAAIESNTIERYGTDLLAPAALDTTIDDETRERELDQLRALGYIK